MTIHELHVKIAEKTSQLARHLNLNGVNKIFEQDLSIEFQSSLVSQGVV